MTLLHVCVVLSCSRMVEPLPELSISDQGFVFEEIGDEAVDLSWLEDIPSGQVKSSTSLSKETTAPASLDPGTSIPMKCPVGTCQTLAYSAPSKLFRHWLERHTTT